MAFKAGLGMVAFKGAVYFPPESEGLSPGELDALEDKGSLASPSKAAFIAAAFRKSG